MRLHGLFVIVTSDKNHVPHPKYKDDGVWEYLTGRFDTDLAVSAESGLEVAACSMNEKKLHAGMARDTKGETVLWRFIFGPAPRKPLAGTWVQLTDAELDAVQPVGKRRMATVWLAMLAAEARCRALGVWPPPPTDEWTQATPSADPRQVALPGVSL